MPEFDVVIVGAGVAGSIAAHELATSGARVCVLEAGAPFGEVGTHVDRFVSAAAKTPDSPWLATRHAPRPTVLDMKFKNSWRDNPSHHLIQRGPFPFTSAYERGEGGTGNHWLGTCLRLVPNDFRLESGVNAAGGRDWPITYEALEPFYSRAEKVLGVSGAGDLWGGIHGAHRSAPFPMPPISQSYLDRVAASKLDGQLVRGEKVRVVPTPQARNSRPYDGRPPCMGNTSCVPICPIDAKYNPRFHLRRAERALEAAELRFHAVAHRVEIDEQGLVASIRYYDCSAGTPVDASVTARLFVLAANAIEIPRLLLNSPWGGAAVANSSDQVGRNLMDHLVCLGWGLSPEPVYPYRGPLSTSGIEAFRDGPWRQTHSAFRIEINNTGWAWPELSPYRPLHRFVHLDGRHGRDLRDAVETQITRELRIGAELEMLPRSTNRIELSEHLDSLGIPKPSVRFELSDYEKRGFVEASETISNLFQLLGAEEHTRAADSASSTFEQDGRVFEARGAGHLLGTTRMGSDPQTSVVDLDCRSHDHANLFVLGSSVFPSSGTANPTLTIAALALRTVDTITEELGMSQKEPHEKMASLIDEHRGRASQATAHRSKTIGGHSVAWWLDLENATTEEFMRALRSDLELVRPGDPAASGLLRYARPGRPMGEALGTQGEAVVRAWIADGARVAGDDAGGGPGHGGGNPPGSGAARLPTIQEEKEAFHKLLNLEDFPEYLPTAKALASVYLQSVVFPEDGPYGLFPYTEDAFEERMRGIYEDFLPSMHSPHRFDSGQVEKLCVDAPDVLARLSIDAVASLDLEVLSDSAREQLRAAGIDLSDSIEVVREDEGALWELSVTGAAGKRSFLLHRAGDVLELRTARVRAYDVGRFSDSVVKDRSFQVAPFNLTDGAWLRQIVQAAPMNAVQARLFDIWADEAGNGNIEENHANVYDVFLRSLGIYLPSVSSREFLKLDFHESAWRAPLFQLAIGTFPQAYFPELLGMTLLLEWEATPTLTPMVRMLEGRGFSPLFYQLHVAIDNISRGHGAKAKEAVKIYLADRMEEGGDVARQEAWVRIWRGYVGWATVGFFGRSQLKRQLELDKKQLNRGGEGCAILWPDMRVAHRRAMAALIAEKAPAARQVHGDSRVAGQTLNALFDDPERLMDALVASRHVSIENPSSSRLFELMAFDQPMYSVFSDTERRIVLEWIESLGRATYPIFEPESEVDEDPLPGMVELVRRYATQAGHAHDGITLEIGGEPRPLSGLFADPETLLAALVSNGWVVPGEPQRSMFFTQLLGRLGPMGGAFEATEVDLVRRWIARGAPSSHEAARANEEPLAQAAKAIAKPHGEGRPSRELIGMGCVH